MLRYLLSYSPLFCTGGSVGPTASMYSPNVLRISGPAHNFRPTISGGSARSGRPIQGSGGTALIVKASKAVGGLEKGRSRKVSAGTKSCAGKSVASPNSQHQHAAPPCFDH